MRRGCDGQAPVVGPLPKETFLEALSGFEITTGFPNLNSNYHDFRVDQWEANKVP